MEIWFNPSCSKCQAAVAAVEGASQAYTLRSYLDVPPTEPELDALLSKLGKEPWEVCRMKEPVASELGIASLPKERAPWIRVMALHPILIERPILVRSDGHAVVGRSAEALEEALASRR